MDYLLVRGCVDHLVVHMNDQQKGFLCQGSASGFYKVGAASSSCQTCNDDINSQSIMLVNDILKHSLKNKAK